MGINVNYKRGPVCGFRKRTLKTAMRLHSGIGSGSLAGVHPDSLVPAAVTITPLAVQIRSLSDIDFSPTKHLARLLGKMR